MSEADSWEVRFSNSHSRPYFFNQTTRESRWDKPPTLSDSAIQSLPGAKLLDSAKPPSKVRSSHILVKHRDSRRPSSWKEQNITRTKAEAREILEYHLETLKGSDNLAGTFAELAVSESDCSSHRDGGDLGWFGPNQMQKPFEEATYRTPVGQISGLVETDSGVHIILRTG